MLHRYSTLRQFHHAVASQLPRGFPPFPPKKYNKQSNFDDAYLKVRCVQFHLYFNAILNLQSIRTMPAFQALFLPQDAVEELEEIDESEEEGSVVKKMAEENEFEVENVLEEFQELQDLFFHFVVELFQMDASSKLQNRLCICIDK